MAERPAVEKGEQLRVFLTHEYDFSAGGDRAMIDLYALNEIDLRFALLNERALGP